MCSSMEIETPAIRLENSEDEENHLLTYRGAECSGCVVIIVNWSLRFN